MSFFFLLNLILVLSEQYLQIVINFDLNPEDISWVMTQESSGYQFSNKRSAAGIVPEGNYTFEITDSYGDGLCCDYGFGGYDLRLNSLNFYSSNGTFGKREMIVFTINEDGSAIILEKESDTFPSKNVPNETFEIELVPVKGFDPTGYETILSILELAVQRWSKIIVGDLPDINGIDDLQITYSFDPIDGIGKVIGFAGPTHIRAGTAIPYKGIMTFDSSDINRLSSKELEALFLHEIGHVLGIGTIWNILGCSKCPGDEQYKCPYAVAAFETISGTTDLLIETDGGSGTACAHFDEVQLKTELMTGYLNGGISEVSAITIGALEDLGYEVDYSQADDFQISSSTVDIILDISNDILVPKSLEIDSVDREKNQSTANFTSTFSNGSNKSFAILIIIIASICIVVIFVIVYILYRLI